MKYNGAALFVIIIQLTVSINPQIRFIEHTVKTNFKNTMSVRSVDMDKDGDMDVVACAVDDNKISWFENDGEMNFTEHTVSTTSTGARTICVCDMDNDGDSDIISAAYYQNRVSVWRNNGSQVFTEVVVSDSFAAAHTVSVADLNRDGKPDIMCAGMYGSGFKWWENRGDLSFTEHTITLREGPTCILSYDMNNDNIPDILTATYAASGGISIWINDGSQNFTETFLPFPFVHWVAPCDIDNDGDIDLAAAACGASVRWYENIGGLTFNMYSLTSAYNCGTSVFWADIDKDNNMDLLSTAENSNELTCWRNNGDKTFTRYPVSSYTGASDVYPVDLDKDGDTDLLCAYRFDNSVRLWENTLRSADFSVNTLTGHAPLQVQFADSCRFPFTLNSYSWDFNNDGTYESSLQNPAWTYQQPGKYTVKLKVTAANFTQTRTKQELIRVFNGESALEMNSKTNSKAVIGATPGISFNKNFTFETVFYPVSWGPKTYGESRIFSKGPVEAFFNNRKALKRKPESLILSVTDSNNVTVWFSTGDSTIKLNTWQHFAVSVDSTGQGVKVYLNGRLQTLTVISAQTALTAPIKDNSTNPLIIGNSTDSTAGFDGFIDEIRLWNRERDAAQIYQDLRQYVQVNDPGLKAYWKCNEAGGSIINDLTGGNNTGALTSVLWCQGINFSQITDAGCAFSGGLIPERITLAQNYPNPFNPSTRIAFYIPNSSSDVSANRATLKVYNLLGRLCVTLFDGACTAGTYSANWNAADFSSGVYIYELVSGRTRLAGRMILIK